MGHNGALLNQRAAWQGLLLPCSLLLPHTWLLDADWMRLKGITQIHQRAGLCDRLCASSLLLLPCVWLLLNAASGRSKRPQHHSWQERRVIPLVD